MPQIREQIAMVHLPPSKTLKYLFHVRKTTKPLKADAFKGFIYEYLWTAKVSDSSSRRLKQVEKVFHLDILLLFHSAMATIASYR